MDSILFVFNALSANDYTVLSDPKLVWTLYFVLFLILFLENGFLPLAFLPGDSLLVLTGVLVSQSESLTLFGVIIVLTLGAGLGTWVGYWQGRWLGNTQTVQNWLSHLPDKYHQRTNQLFDRHGLLALFIGRFIAFVRTLLPLLMGVSRLADNRFQLYNWLSAVLWVGVLVLCGYFLGMSSFFRRHESMIVTLLMLLPFILLVIGLVSSIFIVVKKRQSNR